MDISQHIKEENDRNEFLKFALVQSEEGLPLSLEVRFNYSKTTLTSESWEGINGKIEEYSHYNAFISTSEKMFKRGIIEIKISSMSKTFNEDELFKIINTLESFFKRKIEKPA